MQTENQPKKLRVGRSILAVIAGIVATFALSYGTDAILMATGALPTDGRLPMYGSELLVALILIYRIVYSVIGCYVAAWLAPYKPMTHAVVLGVIGFLGAMGGAFAGADLAPAWYSWGIVVFALPAAWLGGKLYSLKAKA